VPVAGVHDTGGLIVVHSHCSGIVCLVCLAILTLPSCGGDDPTSEPVTLTVGTGTGAIETGIDGSTYRSDDFTFAFPAGWAETPGTSTESYGQVASAASVAPEGTASSSLVNVFAYVRPLGEPPDNPHDWFAWFTQLNDAEVSQAVSEIELDGGTAWQGSLKVTDKAGNPVEVRIVRAVRGDRDYQIICQAEPADRAAITSGCDAIVKSFRAT